MNSLTFIKDNLNLSDKELSALLEKTFKDEDHITKMKYNEFENIINTLFVTNKSQSIKTLNSYYNLLVNGNTSFRIFSLSPLTNNITASSREMIQNYKYIYMFCRFIDCSELLKVWSPTEAYFPVLLYIIKSNPDKPIDYSYWLRRFKDLPTAFKFIKQNNIKLDFTEEEDLKTLYKTLPQKYIGDFLDALGDKSWYMDAIKEVDHFLEEVEDWEEDLES